jgi:hypothetical protein
MKLARRIFLHLAAGAVAMPRVATAKTYPTRPITMTAYAILAPSRQF